MGVSVGLAVWAAGKALAPPPGSELSAADSWRSSGSQQEPEPLSVLRLLRNHTFATGWSPYIQEGM